MRQHRRRAPLALIATALVGLSANAQAALSFNCSESLTVDTSNGFVMHCTGQLDVLGQGATDPDSVLTNSQFIRIEATKGLSLDQLTLAAPSIELYSAQKVAFSTNTTLIADTIDIQVKTPSTGTPSGAIGTSGAPAVLQPIGTRPDIALRLDPNRDDALTWGTVEVRSGADLTVRGTMSANPLFVMPTSPVPEPSTWALLLGGLGLVALARRRQSA